MSKKMGVRRVGERKIRGSRSGRRRTTEAAGGGRVGKVEEEEMEQEVRFL